MNVLSTVILCTAFFLIGLGLGCLATAHVFAARKRGIQLWTGQYTPAKWEMEIGPHVMGDGWENAWDDAVLTTETAEPSTPKVEGPR